MKPNPEVDQLISLMRQSRMDAIREELELLVKKRDSGSREDQIFLDKFRYLFELTSTYKNK